jgi:hypothetical protein
MYWKLGNSVSLRVCRDLRKVLIFVGRNFGATMRRHPVVQCQHANTQI